MPLWLRFGVGRRVVFARLPSELPDGAAAQERSDALLLLQAVRVERARLRVPHALRRRRAARIRAAEEAAAAAAARTAPRQPGIRASQPAHQSRTSADGEPYGLFLVFFVLSDCHAWPPARRGSVRGVR